MVLLLFYAFFFAFFIFHKDKKKRNKASLGLLAAVGGGGGGLRRRVIADSGASMHAVGDCRLLKDLRFYVDPQPVRLPNHAALRVLGTGRLEWGSEFSVPDVSLVEGFQQSLISVSQLDRQHGMHVCFGSGKAEVMLHDGTVVGGAILDDSDGMYVLSSLHVP